MPTHIKHIIWDWNGTLLDDTDICIGVINIMLTKRNLPKVDAEIYRKYFMFPVIEYYKKIGFTFEKESFAEVSEEFIALYHEALKKAKLFTGIPEILATLKKRNIGNYILSAMEQNALIRSVTSTGIFHLLDSVQGIQDNFAHSKVDTGRTLMLDHKLDPATTCLVGDTIHDFEVSQALQCDALLVSCGHQNADRLKSTGAPVLKNVADILDIIQ